MGGITGKLQCLWGTWGCQPLCRLFCRDSQNRYKTMHADVISSTERAQLWKSFPPALDQAPQGQHSFSASWSTNWFCLTQHDFCDNWTWSIHSGHSNNCHQQQHPSATQMSVLKIWNIILLQSNVLKHFICLENIAALQFRVETTSATKFSSVSKKKGCTNPLLFRFALIL